jgi:hypothetical protein
VWTVSTAPRIAGVAVVPMYFSYTNGITPTQTLGYQVFFLAEDGSLARYDFTQTNGVLELAGVGSFAFASSAPAPVAAGEAYGALKARNLLAPITGTSVSSNILTVTAANNFATGDTVNITGTAESFLNGQTVTVLPGATTSSFTANFTASNYTNNADTGTASGWSLWALYGTMTPDPRTTQTGLANPANINLFRYNISAGTWSGPINSGLTGRHNGRSLNEFIVKRDGRIYIMCEDVTSGGGTVANAFGALTASGVGSTPQMYNINWQIMCYDPVAATWNTSKVNGSTSQPITYGSTGFVNVSGGSVTWVSGDLFIYPGNGGQWPIVINGVVYNISSVGSYTSLNLTTSAGTQSNVPYSLCNMGAHNSAPFQGQQGGGDFWFYNINCSMHDVAPDVLLIQPNWTAGTLQTLNTSTAPALVNADLTMIPTAYNAVGSIMPSPGPSNYFPGQADPTVGPVDIIHNRDYANGAGDRTIFVVGHFIYLSNGANSNGGPWIPLLYAPPSYNWLSPTALSFMYPNAYSGSEVINTWGKDCWSYAELTSGGNSFDHEQWAFPTIVEDNYIHFVRGSGSADGYANTNTSGSGITYGRAFYQTIGYLPTYWKWTGSAWVIADSWTDAAASPYTIPAANTNVPLPYGLQVQFGPASGNSLTGGEFDTFNLCYGNTKYTRKGRFSWAMFAGQTFVNTDTRTVASQNAMTMNFIDTDIWQTPTFTAPTSATPQTATILTAGSSVGSYPISWNTQALWPKLDTTNTPFDATPFTMTCSVGSAGAFNPNTWVNAAAFNVTGGFNTYNWTVGGNTYVTSSSGDNLPSWYAFAGNPQLYWQSSGGSPWYVQIDLGTATPPTVLSYGWRLAYDSGDNFVQNGNPASYQLQASNNGTFTDNGGGPFVVDDRTGGNALTSWKRGVAFNCNGATGSYRYYRMYITTVGAGGAPCVSMLRLNSSVLQTSVNFSDFAFFGYGSQTNNTYGYPWLRNWQWVRGLTIAVSTNGGSSYTTIMEPATTGNPTGIQPLWRSHTGNVFTFPRQVGVTNIKITCESGFNFCSQPNGNNVPLTTGFGPFYLFDYDPQDITGQAALNAARLGSSLAPVGTVDAASWDPQCIGMSKDTASLSFDGSSPNAIIEYGPATSIGGTVNNYAGTLFSFWDFYPITGSISAGTAIYKMHPFFGFTLLPGAGADAAVSNVTGYTNMVITYQWGRRV